MKKVILLALLGFCATALAQRFVRTANTIAELVASNPNNVHTNVLVLGLTNVNDSQGGAFSWVVGATNTTNGFAVFASSTATNGQWIRRSYSSDTNYGGNSYITNLYVTNITANTIYSTNLYVTNLYTSNIVGGNIGASFQTIGTGANFGFSGGPGNETWQQITFATGTPAFVLTNAGKYLITGTIVGYAASTQTTEYRMTNTTTLQVLSGSQHINQVSSLQNAVPITFLYTATNALESIQLWGFPQDLTYANEVVATNTVITVIRLQ